MIHLDLAEDMNAENERVSVNQGVMFGTKQKNIRSLISLCFSEVLASTRTLALLSHDVGQLSNDGGLARFRVHQFGPTPWKSTNSARG